MAKCISTPASPRVGGNPPLPPITITTSGGNFSYSAATLHVQSGDTVTWQCQNPFSVMFKEDTPIGQVTLHGEMVSGQYVTPANLGEVRADASGHYHYGVAVYDGSAVQLDIGCPDLVAN
jgi:plastocyanin